MGAAMFPAVIGNDAVTQHLASIENGIGSRVHLHFRRLIVQNDPLAVLTSVMPIARISRGVNISGGVLLAKSTFDTTDSSDPFVRIRSALGEGAPITATAGTTVWQQYTSRLHTAVEQVLGNDENLLPSLVETVGREFVLNPGESALITVVGATTASNAALTNNWLLGCAWEEEPVSTFSISGTVTLSGSPVSGATVTVVEADDLAMTNAHLLTVITTGGGGTWSADILTGKVGYAYVQYETGGTMYTAPGSPYLEAP